MKKKIIILGSTGTLGKSTLDIISNDKRNYNIELLVANKNFKTIYKQVIKFKPKFVYLADKIYSNRLSKLLKNNKTKIISNFDEINKKISKSDIMMSSITGLDGLKYNLSLIKKAKKILFANKESIICGWNLIKKEMDKYNSSYVPVDSEHFAISELIKNKDIKKIKNITITASGGPFFNFEKKLMKNINKKMALKHPRWKMGKKISIDSATMMNKIFEVMEAYRLFDLKSHQIDITIHPQSIVHAIVNYKNGTSHALLHNTDMRIPISSGMNNDNVNNRSKFSEFNINKFNKMNFYKTSTLKFPSLNILKNISEKCTLFDTVLISANDELVDQFLKDKIQFKDIILNLKRIIKLKSLNKYKSIKPKNFKEIQELNHSVRLKTRTICI